MKKSDFLSGEVTFCLPAADISLAGYLSRGGVLAPGKRINYTLVRFEGFGSM